MHPKAIKNYKNNNQPREHPNRKMYILNMRNKQINNKK